ncbi:hypothetical protein Glove_29g30 [Diversispora epigaea]|uniref:BZIP domain-containing protein n=1 Tax=Diversispora epigaea TaxID=1348612 RepID=A0A397JKN0_9GLOM|nr:hypothetical protein Glove_29g30 [Diversispora epigaea]
MENTHILLNELSSLSPNQTFCNESFSFMNELTIQDVECEIGNQSKKRNREECEGGEEGEGSRKRSHREDEEALRYRKKKKNEAEKLEQKVNELEEKNSTNNIEHPQLIKDYYSILMSQKRNREECEGGEEGEGSRKRSHREDEEALRYRKKKKNEAEKLEQKVNELEEKNRFLKNEVNRLSKEFLELRDFLMIDIICNHL